MSLILLLVIALSGISTVGGAFAAAVFFAVRGIIQKHINIDPNLFIGVGAVFLGRNQGGAAGQFADAVDWLRRLRGSPAPAPAVHIESEEAHLVSAPG